MVWGVSIACLYVAASVTLQRICTPANLRSSAQMDLVVMLGREIPNLNMGDTISLSHSLCTLCIYVYMFICLCIYVYIDLIDGHINRLINRNLARRVLFIRHDPVKYSLPGLEPCTCACVRLPELKLFSLVGAESIWRSLESCFRPTSHVLYRSRVLGSGP